MIHDNASDTSSQRRGQFGAAFIVAVKVNLCGGEPGVQSYRQLAAGHTVILIPGEPR